MIRHRVPKVLFRSISDRIYKIDRIWAMRELCQRQAGVGPQQRMQPGYEVSKVGTKGVPLNRRVRASMAPTAFLRAVEM